MTKILNIKTILKFSMDTWKDSSYKHIQKKKVTNASLIFPVYIKSIASYSIC